MLKKNYINFCLFLFSTFFLFLLINTNAYAERLAVIVKTANIRSGPGLKYDLIWKVDKFFPIKIIKKSGNWYNFSDFESETGWIYKNNLKKIKTIITLKEKCNIRSGPGIKNKIIFTAEKGVAFKVIKIKEDWLNILHADGDIGWIHKSIVW